MGAPEAGIKLYTPSTVHISLGWHFPIFVRTSLHFLSSLYWTLVYRQQTKNSIGMVKLLPYVQSNRKRVVAHQVQHTVRSVNGLCQPINTDMQKSITTQILTLNPLHTRSG